MKMDAICRINAKHEGYRFQACGQVREDPIVRHGHYLIMESEKEYNIILEERVEQDELISV